MNNTSAVHRRALARQEAQRWRQELHTLWQREPGRLLALLRCWLDQQPPTKGK